MVFTLFGTLIDDAAIQKFKEQKHVIPILSMEGNEGVTDLRRVAEIYGRLMKDMAKLNENGLFFGTSLTVTKTSYDTVTGVDFIRRMREHGCKAFIFVEYNPAQEGIEGLVVTDERREEILGKMATYCKALQGITGEPKLMESGGGCALWRKPEWVK